MDLDKVPEQQRAGLAVMNANAPMATLTKEQLELEMHAVVERVLDGETMGDIAAQYRIGPKRLYKLVAANAEDAWKSAQIAKCLMTLDDAEQDLSQARDIVELGSARERLKSAQWQLERLHRRLFGSEQSKTDGQLVQINIEIHRDPKGASNAIDVTPTKLDGD